MLGVVLSLCSPLHPGWLLPTSFWFLIAQAFSLISRPPCGNPASWPVRSDTSRWRQCCPSSRPPKTTSLGTQLSPCAQGARAVVPHVGRPSFISTHCPELGETAEGRKCLLPGGSQSRGQRTEKKSGITPVSQGRVPGANCPEENQTGRRGCQAVKESLSEEVTFKPGWGRSWLCKVWGAAIQREGGWSKASGQKWAQSV